MARVAPIVRAAAAPVALAVARARAAPSRWLLPALGVALAVALLGAARGGGAVAGEQAAHRAVAGLTPAQRAIRLTWSGGVPPRTDARARRVLRGLSTAPQTRSVLYLPTSVTARGRSHEVQLAAVRPLSRWVLLTAGRLPRTCTAVRCEVLAAGGGRAPRVVARNGTRLVTVGHATLTSTVPLGFVPSQPQRGAPAGAGPRPLLLGADPRAADAAPGMENVFRTQGWTAPLTAAVPSWELGRIAARFAAARVQLGRATDEFGLQAPDAPLEVAQARAREARHRVTLVGAGAAALLAAFVILAAAAMRPDLDRERGRLERRGARRWQLGLLSGAEALWPAAAGVIAGAVLALAVTALRAHAGDVPVRGVLEHALLTPRAVAVAAGVAVLTCVLLGLAARPWGPAAGRVADVAALGAAGALAVALARGGGDAPGDPLPALLPPLACLVAAIVIARVAGPALRGVEATARRGPLAGRLATLNLTRTPQGAALTIAVVAVGCGLSCFAWAYRATLHRGDADQAAYRVPLDVTVGEGPQFTSPLSLLPEARWRALAGGGTVVGLQRTSASVPRGAGAVELPLLALPASALGTIRRWRASDASSPRGQLARRLRLPGPLAPRGPLVRAGDQAISLRTRAVGDAVQLTALLQDAAGAAERVPLGAADARRRRLVARLPPSATTRRLVGIEVELPSGLVATNRHQEAERSAVPAIERGSVAIDGLRVGGRTVGLGTWIAHGPLRRPRATGGGGVQVPYAFDRRGRALLTPRQPGEGRVLPVLTDRATAASVGPRGLLPVTVEGERLRGRVVGTVARFPTVPASADGVIVTDRASLAAVLQPRAPGSTQADELWIAVAPGRPEQRLRAALSRPPLRGLDVASRRADEQVLRTDPLARELVRTLAGAGLVALALAALGVLVAVALAVRDDAAELFDLEALGAAPALLRDEIRVRAALLAGLGLAAGVALGAALTRLAVDAVQVTAAGARAVPPLVAVAPWASWGLTATAFAAAVAAGVALLTRRALSGPVPRRAPGGGG